MGIASPAKFPAGKLYPAYSLDHYSFRRKTLRLVPCALRPSSYCTPIKHVTELTFFVSGNGGEDVLFIFGRTLGHDGCCLELPIPAIDPLQHHFYSRFERVRYDALIIDLYAGIFLF